MKPSILDNEDDLDNKDICNFHYKIEFEEGIDAPTCDAIGIIISNFSFHNFGTINKIVSTFGENNPLNIVISDKRPKFAAAELLKEKLTQDEKKELENLILLGEYKPSDKSIWIYINNIKSLEPDFWEALFLTTFAHELMHAYFDRDNNNSTRGGYIKEIEEPLAEFGMLLLINHYAKGGEIIQDDQKILIIDNVFLWSTAYKHVKDKQKSDAISYYGYGACLYNAWKNAGDSRKLDFEKLVLNYKTGGLLFH